MSTTMTIRLEDEVKDRLDRLAESPSGWEDAAQKAVAQASETLHGVKSIYIKDMEAVADNGKIRSYRINAKISFELEGKKS